MRPIGLRVGGRSPDRAHPGAGLRVGEIRHDGGGWGHRLLRRRPRQGHGESPRKHPGHRLHLGDNVYHTGTRSEFKNCYDPTWGKYKQRTRPAAGNHEYYTLGARPYYDYFGARAGKPRRGYYAYDKGTWHVVVLNSNCGKVGCGPGSRQAEWLRKNLDNNRSRCTLAYGHHPLFASNASTGSVKPFWEILYNRDADVILSGHAHSYERFAPQTPGGRKNEARGIREFVVGTGGKPPEGPFNPRPANSQVRNDKTPGVLRLRLRPGSYAWKFVHVAGKTFTDSGTDSCH